MVALANGKGVPAPLAERLGEFPGEPVQGENALGLHALDKGDEVVESRVVGKRKGGVAARAVDRAGVERPAGDDGRAPGGQAAEQALAMGRAQDDMAAGLVGVEFTVRREFQPELLADPRKPQGVGVQHHRQLRRGEGAQDLLTLAQAVAEQNRRGAVGEGAPAEFDDPGDDLRLGREDIAREAEGGLHDEHIGARGGTRLGGEAGAELEVPRVEQRAVLGALEQDLARAEDVAGGMQRGGDAEFQPVGTAERQGGLLAFARHPGVHQARSGGGAENLAVPGDVVAMGVGNEGAGGAHLGVEPPADLRQPDPLAMMDLPSHGAERRLRRGRGSISAWPAARPSRRRR